MAAPKSISLLPREGFEYTTVGRTVTWALGIGRVIVVAVELIVIVAFLSRFWLDRQLTNLNKQIAREAQIVQASSQTEQTLRVLQQKLAGFTLILATFIDQPDLVRTIVTNVPSQVSLSQISVDTNQAQVSGIALSEAGLMLFIQQLEQQKKSFASVQLTEASAITQQETGLRFTIRIPIANTKQ